MENTTPIPHKHADLIIQWALYGAEIQVKDSIEGKWHDRLKPHWEPDCEYRIKPVPKPDVVVYANMDEYLENDFQHGTSLCGRFSQHRHETDNIKVTYNGETGKLIAIEMIEQE